MDDSFSWTDIEDIAIALAEKHPDLDPLAVRFTELRSLVESLDDFRATEEHTVNEQILEAIQANWYQEAQDLASDNDNNNRNNDRDERPTYSPMNPFKPDVS